MLDARMIWLWAPARDVTTSFQHDSPMLPTLVLGSATQVKRGWYVSPWYVHCYNNYCSTIERIQCQQLTATRWIIGPCCFSARQGLFHASNTWVLLLELLGYLYHRFKGWHHRSAPYSWRSYWGKSLPPPGALPHCWDGLGMFRGSTLHGIYKWAHHVYIYIYREINEIIEFASIYTCTVYYICVK